MLPQEPAPPRQLDRSIKPNLSKGDLVVVRRKISAWTELHKVNGQWRGWTKTIDKNSGVGIFIGTSLASQYEECPNLEIVFGDTVYTVDWEKAHYLSIVSDRQRNKSDKVDGGGG